MKSVLYFTTPTCIPCQAMKPAFIELMEEQGIEYRIVDAYAQPEIAQAYKVRGVPTLIVFKDGQQVEQVSGPKTKEQILELLED